MARMSEFVPTYISAVSIKWSTHFLTNAPFFYFDKSGALFSKWSVQIIDNAPYSKNLEFTFFPFPTLEI